MELKINWGERYVEKAKNQLTAYLDRLGLNEGYLVLFDPGAKTGKKNYISRILLTTAKRSP